MNEHILAISEHLKEIASEYDLDFSSNVLAADDKIMFAYTNKPDLVCCKPSFMLMFDFREGTFSILCLNKKWELKDYESVFRLLCEIIA